MNNLVKMIVIFTSVVLICFSSVVLMDDSILNNSELIMTFLVHRHGDRTPMKSQISYSTDPAKLEELSAKYGYGQLTNVGIKRGYQLGKVARRRYGKLLSSTYNRSEIYIRATDSTRAKMTVLAAMSAVYASVEDNWSSEIKWTPVPYTNVPAKYDFNLAVVNCPNFMTKYYTYLMSPTSEMDPHTDLLNEWSEYIGTNITTKPAMAYVLNDVYTAQMSMGIPLTDEVAAIYPEIVEAAGAAFDVIFGNEDSIAYQSGVLLNEFFTAADQIIAGEDVQRVQWYSAHDSNVFSFMAASKITPRLNMPKYGSMFALELRQIADGNYLVVPVYLADPSIGEFSYLQVEGCDGFCDLETFRIVTSEYAMDEDTWRTNCGFTEDLVIDISSVA